MNIDIVIVNWNAGSQLRECVDSVLAHGDDVVSQVIVVDNGSTDGSSDMVENLLGVKVIRTGENLGFAAACNMGAMVGDAQYLLFLNPDTRVEAGSFSVPLAFMRQPENARVGICGIQLVDKNGKVSRTCAEFPTLLRLTASALGVDRLPGLRGMGMRMAEWDHDDTRRVDQVMGAFFLVRREVFSECKGFDERFFVYFEEVELARRAQLAGWESWYLTGARAFHAGGGTSRQVKTRRLFYSLRSRLLYGFKHFPSWQAWLLVAVTGLIEPVTRTAWCIARGDRAGVRQTWSAYRMLWCSMGRIMRGEGRWNP
ncbi:glycosyltransferase family 2 protein [Chromohalobacter sp. 11-W]|uniref:glycosyltransferase family 2 protein n=1 Tax=Chromohalobacter sp. 11-W TaxID=2994061 RepID=UPI002468750F|nr:glycosyltransferase family 2 protein [Chromohalobacter sp. 11-W]